MKYQRHAILALAAAAFTASAQDLSTEVVVERNIKPVEQTATRLNGVSPAIVAPRVENKRLDAAEYNGQPTLTTVLSRLEPAPYADTIPVSPWRGYVAGGYFPAYNLGITAGYRIVNKPRTAVGVDMMFNGMSYKVDNYYGKKWTYSRNSVQLNAYAQHIFNAGTLGANLGYGHIRLGQPYIDIVEEKFTQRINRLNFGIDWQSAPIADNVTYALSGNISTFGFSEALPWGITSYIDGGGYPDGILHPEVDGEPVKGAVYKFSASLGQKLDNGFRWQLDADADIQHLNRNTHIVWRNDYATSVDYDSSHNYSIIGLTPTLGIERDHFNARLGARIDFLSGTDRSTLHIAPAVHVAWMPASQFAVWGSATGGEQLNTLASLYEYCPWMIGSLAYAPSSVPLDIQAGVNVGPLAGFTLKLWAGWSKANNWLMPNLIDNITVNDNLNTFDSQSIEGWHYGAEARYAHRYFEIYTGIEGAQSSHDYGYYLWRDRAKLAFKAGVSVKPIAKLQIDADFSLRTSRKSFTNSIEDGIEWYTPIDLGNANNLSLGGRYAVTPALSVFLRMENMLGKRYMLIPNIESQGFHGLLGAEFKF